MKRLFAGRTGLLDWFDSSTVKSSLVTYRIYLPTTMTSHLNEE